MKQIFDRLAEADFNDRLERLKHGRTWLKIGLLVIAAGALLWMTIKQPLGFLILACSLYLLTGFHITRQDAELKRRWRLNAFGIPYLAVLLSIFWVKCSDAKFLFWAFCWVCAAYITRMTVRIALDLRPWHWDASPQEREAIPASSLVTYSNTHKIGKPAESDTSRSSCSAAVQQDSSTQKSSSAPDHLRIRASIVPAIISILFVVLALGHVWPAGFYALLRFTVCGSAIYLAAYARKKRTYLWIWAMLGIAILFNPLVPITLPRPYWQVLDSGTAILFSLSIFKLRSKRGEPKFEYVRKAE